MALSEQAYITLCKRQIEKKFSFGNGHGYTQRDLEVLSQHIQEKAGVNISLSTLKRLWKDDFKQRPQLATLNALAAILDYKDWQEFKQQNQKTEPAFSRRLLTGIIFGLALLIIAAFVIVSLNNTSQFVAYPKKPKINGPVQFSVNKTVTSGIPNTVIFKYDVSNVEADSFFIQQTWNPNHRMAIDPKGDAFSNIYYESGYHRARLFANDSVIAMQPIHILSDGWEPHIYYSDKDLVPIDFKGEPFIANGQLHLSKAMLEKRGVDGSKPFYSRITNSQEFNVSSDNFSVVTRMKVDSVLSSLCPWMTLIVVTEKHIFMVALQNKGCERYASYKLGEIERYGENNDLSALGCHVYDWQEVGVRVEDKNAEIYLNGQKAFQEQFKEDFGEVVGLIYIFDGVGSIEQVQLAGEYGQTVFEDHFEGSL